MNKKILVTGGCGFLESNIASKIIKTGSDLIIFDSLFRFGSAYNKEWLEDQGEFFFSFRAV